MPSTIVHMLSLCTDLSVEKRTFLKAYLHSRTILHGQNAKDLEGGLVYTSPLKFYRMADGTIVSATTRSRIVTCILYNYIKTGMTSDQMHYSSTWVYTKYGYVHSTKPPKPKSSEEVLEQLDHYTRAMYEAVPVTYVPIGTPLADILSGKVQCCEMPEQEERSRGVFHSPPPLSDLFTEKRSMQLEKLCEDLGIRSEFNLNTWVNATNTVSAVMRTLRLKVEDGKAVNDRTRKQSAGCRNRWFDKPVKAQPATKKVVWKHRNTDERAFLPETIRSCRKYQEATELMGIICGRLLNMNVAALKTEALLISRNGVCMNLIKNMSVETLDIDTAIFCCIVSSAMKQSQRYVKFDKFMQTWYYEILCKSPTTQFNLVASILPVKTVLGLCNTTDMTSILEKWIQFVTALRVPMQLLWVSAVRDATSRNMCIPRGFDVAGWNVMTRAWNRARYEIASICGFLKIPMPWAITKCLGVTTGDRIDDAGFDENATHPDCMVFAKLAEWGRSPWSAIDDSTLTIEKRMEEITRVCGFRKIANAYKYHGTKDPVSQWQINGHNPCYERM